MITVDELKAMPLDKPIGEAVVRNIEFLCRVLAVWCRRYQF